MARWLLKTEPETYSWDDLVDDGRTRWDGVRNYTARNNLMAMAVGDRCLLYHSVGPKEIVGIVEVVAAHYPDPTIPPSDPEASKGWVAVDIKPITKLAAPVGLAALKAHATLRSMQLVKQSRLSVTPVSDDEWQGVLDLAAAPPTSATTTKPASKAAKKTKTTKAKTKTKKKKKKKAKKQNAKGKSS